MDSSIKKMRSLKDILLIFFLLSFSNLNGQNIISGKIISLDSKNPIKDVEIFEKSVGKLANFPTLFSKISTSLIGFLESNDIIFPEIIFCPFKLLKLSKKKIRSMSFNDLIFLMEESIFYFQKNL